MNSNGPTTTSTTAGRFVWIGPVMGLACMAALFVAGLVKGNAGMVAMAASTAALLVAVWFSTAVAARKKAAKAGAAA